MSTKQVCLSLIILQLLGQNISAQKPVDRNYIREYAHPYVVTLSLERTGAGIQISPDYTVVPPTASFPFNAGTNLALNLYYKFLNIDISKSLNSSTNNKSFVLALSNTEGPHTIGGKLGFYNNIAALNDKQTINTKSSINLFKFSPYWLMNFNSSRFSLSAITDYSQRQRQSAGAFMFEVNPFITTAKGKNGAIIPAGGIYQTQFGKMQGLEKLTIVNLDFRPGYIYTLIFNEGEYFVSGGLFAGAGFGYHSARTATDNYNALHWQTSARILASGGYNQEKYFITASLKYNNSFTPIANIGVLSNEATIQLTFGLRFNALEKALPDTWKEVF